MDTYKYETHLHTAQTSPCGKVKAEDAVRIYHDAGYTGIMVTDHYYSGFFEKHPFMSWDKKIGLYLDGYQKALEAGRLLNVDVHLGMEIRFNESQNEYLVYGFEVEFLHEHKYLYEMSLKDFRELTAGKEIIIVQAHPFRVHMTPAPPSLLDGMEIYNGNPRHDSSNHLAEKYARDNGLKMLSGSDFHQVQDAARGGVILNSRIKPGGFAEIFKQNRIVSFIKT